MRLCILFFFSICLLPSCGSPDRQTSSAVGNMAMDEALIRGKGVEEQAVRTDAAQSSGTSFTRKLIKEGFLTFETDGLAETRQKLTHAILSQQGYISNEQQYRSPDRLSQVLTVRVPSANFDKLLAIISEEAKHFDEKNITVHDVTEEYIDLSARLNTKKELEKRYLDLLKRAGSVKDLVDIERELANVRSEIEAMEGRLKYMDKQVDFSTLTVTFYQRIHGETALGRDFFNGLRNGWKNLLLFFVALVNIWPFILILAFLLLVLIRIRRRRTSRKTTK